MVLKKQDGGVPYTVEEAESVVFLAFSCGQSLALCTVHVRRRKYLERILRLQTQPSSSGKRISIQAQSLLRLHTKQKRELFALLFESGDQVRTVCLDITNLSAWGYTGDVAT